MTDIHHYESRLQSTIAKISKDSHIRPADRRLIADFLDHCKAQGLSAGRRFKLAWEIRSLAKQMPCSFKKATRKDIERVVGWINTSESYSPSTKSDLKKLLKQFYRFVRFGNIDKVNPVPPEVAWVSTAIKRNDVRAEAVITEDEAKRMIQAATSVRDKAFIATAYEGGFRIGELLNMKVGSVRFTDQGCRIQVEHGKTGPREPLLVSSSPAIASYLDSHPFKSSLAAPLWIGIEGPNKNKPLRYAAACTIIQKAASLAGVSKRIHPHLFRSSAATRDAEHGITDRFLETKYGWTNGSKMAAHYSRAFDSKALDARVLEVYSGKQAPRVEPTFRPGICPRCKAAATPGQEYCSKCGSPLDIKLVVKGEEELSEMRRSMELLAGNVNFLMDKMKEELLRREDEESLLEEKMWRDDWMRKHPTPRLSKEEVLEMVRRSKTLGSR